MTPLHTALAGVKSIRLLQLDAGTRDAPISCSLQVVEDCTYAPAYHCISYCWGDANDVVLIQCNGQEFPITRTLHAALVRLRELGHSAHCWADAICIDQSNTAERGHQVSMMNTIFQNASRVYIFTGQDEKIVAKGMRIIHDLADRIHGKNQSGDANGIQIADVVATRDEITSLDKVIPWPFATLSYESWTDLWKFYDASWFTRVWVIQEVRQIRDVRYLSQTSEVEWDMVALIAAWAASAWANGVGIEWPRLPSNDITGFHNAMFMWKTALTTRRRAPFLAILYHTKCFKATDARDKIYALLHHKLVQTTEGTSGFNEQMNPSKESATLGTHLGIIPDYDLSAQEVYQDVAIRSIERYGTLEVLSYACNKLPVDPSWPSWVPKWDHMKNSVMTKLSPFLYNATKETQPTFRLKLTANDQGTIVLCGLKLGQVDLSSSVINDPRIFREEIWENVSSVESTLMEATRILTQDRQLSIPSDENSGSRYCDEFEGHFANFLASISTMIQPDMAGSYVSFSALICDSCEGEIINYRQRTVSPIIYYHCDLCEYGNFDLCVACYESEGVRCLAGHDHTMRETTGLSMYLPKTPAVMDVLKKYSAAGDENTLHGVMTTGFPHSAFFKTSQDLRGSTSDLVQPGDIAVLLFGSQVPFILRREGGRHRLIADCYIDGMMDGEGIDLWKNGKLQEQEFEIC